MSIDKNCYSYIYTAQGDVGTTGKPSFVQEITGLKVCLICG